MIPMFSITICIKLPDTTITKFTEIYLEITSKAETEMLQTII